MAGARERRDRTRGASGASLWRSARTSTSDQLAVAARVWRDLQRSQASLLAAGMAFRALLALFPALLAAVSVFGILADPDDLTNEIRTWLTAVPKDASTLIESELTTIAAADHRTLGFAFATSLLMALWSASGGMYGLMQGCNAAYDVVDRRSYLVKRGIALALVLSVGTFVCVGVGAATVLPLLLDHFGLGEAASLTIRIVQWPLLACVTVVGLGILYRVAPHREAPSARWLTPGVFISVLLWLAGSWLFTFSVQRFGHFGTTYGTIAGVIVLMLWLWLSSFIVLFGATINAELERQSSAAPRRPGPHPR